ncbi:hypothetical protein C8R44DRAFT_981540 [Mycena epipterygia]|nr:hypothetical protein C8R44DRAFT_981540 [Mycena epipterygia]
MKFNALVSLAIVGFAALASSAPSPGEITAHADITFHGDQEEFFSYHPVTGGVRSKARPQAVETQQYMGDCLSETRERPFTLDAVFYKSTAGPMVIPLHILFVNAAVKVSWSILTTQRGSFDFEGLKDGGLQGISAASPYLIATSLAVVRGDSPTFISIQIPPPGLGPYCIMENPVIAPGVPHVLGLDGRSDLFALCRNDTADGRPDVVFDPVANHNHYHIDTCEPIYITLRDV